MVAKKRKMTFSRELRADAKARGGALLGFTLELQDGQVISEQGVIDVHQAMFAKWAMAVVLCEKIRHLPDLEGMIKELMTKEIKNEDVLGPDQAGAERVE